MALKSTATWCVVLGVFLAGGQLAQGAFYDDFADGHYWQDPNDEPYDDDIGSFPLYNYPAFDPSKWDIDNTHWQIRGVIGTNFYADASDGWLRLYGEVGMVGPWAFIGGSVNDGDPDPNTSISLFDDSAPHYLLAKMKSYYTDKGELMVLFHGDFDYWTAYGVSRQQSNGYFDIYYVEGIDWDGASGGFDQDVDEINGYWLALQLEGDGDPNNSILRGAIWDGEKFDWDGTWGNSANILQEWNDHPYLPSGVCGIACLAAPENGGALQTDCKFDQVEARWGIFSNVGRSLTLTVSNPENGTVMIDPDLLVDPNNLTTDPNVPTDPNEPRIYTDGTEVVLVANPDPNGKGFNKWEVTDPLDANNNFTDTNLVLTLTMDRDWEVAAKFKCGSAALMPMIGLTLLALGIGAVIRRLL